MTPQQKIKKKYYHRKYYLRKKQERLNKLYFKDNGNKNVHVCHGKFILEF